MKNNGKTNNKLSPEEIEKRINQVLFKEFKELFYRWDPMRFTELIADGVFKLMGNSPFVPDDLKIWLVIQQVVYNDACMQANHHKGRLGSIYALVPSNEVRDLVMNGVFQKISSSHPDIDSDLIEWGAQQCALYDVAAKLRDLKLGKEVAL